MMAAERERRPGQHNRNNGTNRFRRTGGYSNYRHITEIVLTNSHKTLLHSSYMYIIMFLSYWKW